ncbi:hypothetical protein [uncultured Chryseobacterium sp.]|uniref:hypothetical protein n=1 Tax=uncultured Chryseobacterium sp. TaxID=259322 RepID=UPI0025F997F9|nr:hypothetical protein [uncultured Chryseobacterium sp.]
MSKKRNLVGLYIVPALLLCIPLVGNLISSEVNWSGYDFLIAGVILWSTAGLIHLILSRVAKFPLRIMFCCVMLLVIALIWIELAVGIFGTPLGGN